MLGLSQCQSEPTMGQVGDSVIAGDLKMKIMNIYVLFNNSPSFVYLDTVAFVVPEGEVGKVPVVRLDVEDGTELGVDEVVVSPSRSRVNLSTLAVSQQDESIGWSRFPFWATQT